MYIDYDTYASMSPLKKNQVTPELTPENKSEIVITHWRRFLEANRARLNSEQIQFIEESIAYVRPEIYRQPPSDDYDQEMERRLRELFSFEDVLKLHMEAFKNSGVIRNPIAMNLVRFRPRTEEPENLKAALCDLATLPPGELRSRRFGTVDLPAILGRAFQGMPAGEEFWSLVADEDVQLAARRAWGLLQYRS